MTMTGAAPIEGSARRPGLALVACVAAATVSACGTLGEIPGPPPKEFGHYFLDPLVGKPRREVEERLGPPDEARVEVEEVVHTLYQRRGRSTEFGFIVVLPLGAPGSVSTTHCLTLEYRADRLAAYALDSEVGSSSCTFDPPGRQ